MSPSSDSDSRPTVLIVEDTPDHVLLLHGLLKDRYRLQVANSGPRAIELVAAAPPDLILLDILLPGVSGFEVCERLKADPTTREIPVIFLTSSTEAEDEERGFALGAVDFISKPFAASVVRARIATHLALQDASDRLRSQNVVLEEAVAQRTYELTVSQDVAIRALASLVETRDNETGFHILRTQHYVRALAEQLRSHPVLGWHFTPASIEALFKSAPLHDIGKVGIPDHILLKPGELTAEEFEVMKTHTTLGRDAILAAEKLIQTPSSFLEVAREIAYSH